jgi:hypothetical protein
MVPILLTTYVIDLLFSGSYFSALEITSPESLKALFGYERSG